MSASPKLSIARLDPAGYERVPWKNGGGVMINIATVYRADATGMGWSDIVWRFSRTAIVAPGPFSDFSGFDRAQVVIAGRGLVLETARGEIDLREPFRPVIYPGEPPIASRLEVGPVEVVNLIADRAGVSIALAVLEAGGTIALPAGAHVVYAPVGAVSLRIGGATERLGPDHALSIAVEVAVEMTSETGRAVVGSVRAR